MRKSSLEEYFWGVLTQQALIRDTPQILEGIEHNYRFHPDRLYKIDYAYPDLRIAIELEGGVYAMGRHTRGAGFEGDIKKYNLMATLEWRLLRSTQKLLEDDPAKAIDELMILMVQQAEVKRAMNKDWQVENFSKKKGSKR